MAIEATHIGVAVGSSIVHKHQSRPGCSKAMDPAMDPDTAHSGGTDPDLTMAFGSTMANSD